MLVYFNSVAYISLLQIWFKRDNITISADTVSDFWKRQNTTNKPTNIWSLDDARGDKILWMSQI